MLHLTPPARAEPAGRRAVLLFGAGLIGSRIGAALGRRGWRSDETPTPWQDDTSLVRHLEAAERLAPQGEAARLDVVWSAGRAGFASSVEQTRGEERSFRRVLDFVARLAQRTDSDLFVHLISSAGGLFEGQRHVDRRSRPDPKRPYGALKLRQEELLAGLDAARPVARRVYRLASVYGPAPRGGRRGLIGALLDNARRGRATPIVGQLTTLRDYVFTEDVARHLAEAFRAPAGEDRYEVLASGKPTTIHEIVHHVTKVAHRRPALAFAAQRDNATDITFAPAVLPRRWVATDLETGICQLERGVFGG